ncbi:MAG TPA: glycine cleavage system protein GcvH [Candidatus Nanoarchaeia archaeon]|nr:glycine cleavage system protein GcvH [Candidatus Nanoarchaeia archaeon]
MTNNPLDFKYSREHEWVNVEGDIATVGITDFAQHQLTDIVFVELPEKGKRVEAGKQMAVVESVKSVSDVFAPVSGEVIEVNSKLIDNPEIINNSPYTEGWFVKIRMANKAELDALLDVKLYSALTGQP